MSLGHYLAVRSGAALPRFQVTRRICVPPTSPESAWPVHRQALCGESFPHLTQHTSLLDLKIELARRELDKCHLCPHHCGVNRNAGKVGYCGVANQTAVHWEGVLHGEEIELVPSHEVFLSGCTMRCAFCYSHEHITRPMSGCTFSPSQLSTRIEMRAGEGATNINWVGGEPTVHILTILETLRELEQNIPVIWNSNMYMTPTTLDLLDGVVDLCLGDIHFGNDVCARELGRIPNYLSSVCQALKTAVASGASVIIRHLVMPGHLECCARPAMEWAKQTLPQTPFHLMFQYVPDYRAEGDAVLGRPLSQQEVKNVKQMAQEIGVFLYEENQTVEYSKAAAPETTEFIGDAVDILIHDDGRVSFTRLLDSLLPVAQALNNGDQRVQARQSVQARQKMP